MDDLMMMRMVDGIEEIARQLAKANELKQVEMLMYSTVHNKSVSKEDADRFGEAIKDFNKK